MVDDVFGRVRDLRPAVSGRQQGHWQVSTSGGTQPLWARSGQELFYFAADGALMRVAVAGGLTWAPGTPTKMFDGRHYGANVAAPFRTYDIAANGQRFVMIKSGESESSPPQIVVVQHFDEELKRLVPTK